LSASEKWSIGDYSRVVGKERMIARPEGTAGRSGSNRHYAVSEDLSLALASAEDIRCD
jgi:hypothetical protein